MNPKIAKLRAELEKNTERITRLQARNGEASIREASLRDSLC